jgi:hypothetical protein
MMDFICLAAVDKGSLLIVVSALVIAISASTVAHRVHELMCNRRHRMQPQGPTASTGTARFEKENRTGSASRIHHAHG